MCLKHCYLGICKVELESAVYAVAVFDFVFQMVVLGLNVERMALVMVAWMAMLDIVLFLGEYHTSACLILLWIISATIHILLYFLYSLRMSLWVGLGSDVFHMADNENVRHLTDYDLQLRLNDPNRAIFEEMRGFQVSIAVAYGIASMFTSYNVAVIISRYKLMSASQSAAVSPVSSVKSDPIRYKSDFELQRMNSRRFSLDTGSTVTQSEFIQEALRVNKERYRRIMLLKEKERQSRWEKESRGSVHKVASADVLSRRKNSAQKGGSAVSHSTNRETRKARRVKKTQSGKKRGQQARGAENKDTSTLMALSPNGLKNKKSAQDILWEQKSRIYVSSTLSLNSNLSSKRSDNNNNLRLGQQRGRRSSNNATQSPGADSISFIYTGNSNITSTDPYIKVKETGKMKQSNGSINVIRDTPWTRREREAELNLKEDEIMVASSASIQVSTV